jgi:hypothetical protein
MPDIDLGGAIAAHAYMIAEYITEMKVPPERQQKIAKNVSDAVLFAISWLEHKEMPNA